jgi:hypothetical protein
MNRRYPAMAMLPRRDLWTSPHHALYLEGVLIEAKDLVNGVSIVQAKRVEKIEYFHIELDSHDVIVAEGALSESFINDDSRGLFHNAHEYGALYPDAPYVPARYCAPRLDEGYCSRRRAVASTSAPDCSPQPRRNRSRCAALSTLRVRAALPAGRKTSRTPKRRCASTFSRAVG